MNNRIGRFYVAILEDRVVHIDTNLSSFVEELKLLDAGFRSLSYYSKQFKETDIIFHVSKFGKKYTLQRWDNK